MDDSSRSGDAPPGLAGARPDVSVDDVTVVAQTGWGLGDVVRELGSHQDRNFLFESPDGRVVVKVANSAWPQEALEAQTAAMRAAATSGVVVPSLVREVTRERIGDQEFLVHVVSFVEGESLFERSVLGLGGCRALGTAAGEMVRALSGFAHPGAVRDSEWDLRAGAAVLQQKDPALLRAVAPALARVSALQSRLPVQVIHGDISDSNVLTTPADEVAVIDFGDVGESWRCAELAIAAACVLAKTDDDADAVAAVVSSYAEHVAVTDDELAAVWPLVVLRVAVLLATGDTDADPNAYTREREAHERAAFAAVQALDNDEMTRVIRHAAHAHGVATRRSRGGTT